jgi:hypothetical protein
MATDRRGRAVQGRHHRDPGFQRFTPEAHRCAVVTWSERHKCWRTTTNPYWQLDPTHFMRIEPFPPDAPCTALPDGVD